tara:strand:- start:1021 stop:1317 length:297 start_codon:yes stop_codon:yes gene_type:complete
MNVQNVSTVPSHIDDFIKGNLEQLNKIYQEGFDLLGDGILSFKCQKSENKMDVKYMCEEEIIHSLSRDNWEQIKFNRGEKKLFLIEDYDINSMFFVYI